AERIVTTLSGGERLRTLLARALATEPRVLLADEPIAALDPYHQLHVMQLLRELAGRGGEVIAVLHDLTLAARFCDRLVLLDGGNVVADGPPDAVLNPANIETVYRIDAHFGRVSDQAYVVPWTRRAPPGDEPC
ncbi:MAG: ABC transporter ATP-binding protein, partial [Minwuiales bacterium]|nr:ABC transporter ATP-binding protein [Minwuiales bacterium]